MSVEYIFIYKCCVSIGINFKNERVIFDRKGEKPFDNKFFVWFQKSFRIEFVRFLSVVRAWWTVSAKTNHYCII